MSEFDQVLAALAAHGGDKRALATLVSVEGSNYRHPGARMVVAASDDEAPVGSISGGCLEAEVIETARRVIASGRPRSVTFDHTADDDLQDWGWGLGCPGTVEVFVEPAALAGTFVAAAHAARTDRTPVVVALALEGSHPGARLVIHHDGRRSGTLGHGATDDLIAAGPTLSPSGIVTTADGHRVFVETLRPPIRLVICGRGADTHPLAEFAARLGWVVEHGEDDPAVDARTAVVVMSHNFKLDKDFLVQFGTTPAAYVGVLGPRSRLDRLLESLPADGADLGAGVFDRIHGPAGLDLGAEGPEQIAWSIVSQIVAVTNGASSR